MCRIAFLVCLGAFAAVLLHAASALGEQRAPLTADQAAAVADHNAFAFDLYQELCGGDGNALVAPFSVWTALAMTYAGAGNNTAEQMAEALRYSLPDDRFHAALGGLVTDLNAPRDGRTLSVVNRLFGQDGAPFEQPFLDTNRDLYNAPLELTNFATDPNGARTHINDWVAEQTNDRIKDLLPPESVTPLTHLVLANAVYLKADWKQQFDPTETHDAPFHLAPGETVQAPLMFQKALRRHGAFDGFQMIEMPYKGDDLSMVVMLPDEQHGLEALESSMTAALFHDSVAALDTHTVDIYLPRFEFTNEFNLIPTLQSLGMTDAFSPSLADFGGILDRSQYDFHITGVFHKTFIGVDESGTEAAGATAVVGGPTSVPPPAPEFRADHPFLFAIRDTHSGALLFMGRVNEPDIAQNPNLTSGLAGDFNNDGVVDAADYAVWRENLGGPAGALANDPSGVPIGLAQYATWRANFGAVAPAAAIPEPASTLLWLAAVAFCSPHSRRRARVADTDGCA